MWPFVSILNIKLTHYSRTLLNVILENLLYLVRIDRLNFEVHFLALEILLSGVIWKTEGLEEWRLFLEDTYVIEFSPEDIGCSAPLLQILSAVLRMIG